MDEFKQTKAKMLAAGFTIVAAHNPYWDANGVTFADREGFRVVLSNLDWNV